MTTGPAPERRRVPTILGVVATVACVRGALAGAGGALERVGLLLDVAAAAATAVTAWAMARRPRDRRSKVAWGLLVGFPLAWLAGPVAWLAGLPVAVAFAGRAAAVLLVAGSWWCAARAGGTLTRIRPAVDGGIGAAAAVILGWQGPLGAAWEAAGGGGAGLAAVVPPVAMAGVAVLGAAITVTEMPVGGRRRSGLFVLAMLILAGSDLAWSLGSTPVWAAGWVAYSLAIRMQTGTTPRVARVPSRGRLVYLPYALIVPSAVALAWQARAGGVDAPQVGAGLAVVALLVMRQHVTLLENDQLVLRLEDTEQRLRYRAMHDSLTGLPGRAALHERLSAVIAARTPASPPMALAFVDVDNFKDVNDRHGHAAGDAVLVDIARRLTASVPAWAGEVFAARLGGDEFAVLVVGEAAADADSLAATMTARLDDRVAVGPTSLAVEVSVGVASAAGEQLTSSELLHRADLAMYAVKRQRSADRAPVPGDVTEVEPVAEAVERPSSDGTRSV